MTVAISGSIAYDNIMSFDGNYTDHILPDNISNLSVSFIAPHLRKDFGGCGGNIAYNLRLLDLKPLPISTVGEDFTEYRIWMNENQIPQSGIHMIRGSYTAQCFILSDKNGAQFTAFHPGAMMFAHKHLLPADESISLGIIAPNGSAMLPHSQAMSARHIPYIFDPGQALTSLNKEDCLMVLNHADWLVTNAYEHELLRKITGMSTQQIAANLRAFIITHGAHGAEAFTPEEHIHVPAISVSQSIDNTGCGDAFRAGIIYGIKHQLDWKKSLQLGAVMGGYAVEHNGCQNHRFTAEEFRQRYQQAYQEECPYRKTED